MVWAIVVVAIAVLGVAAWAGTGRLGEMPGPVTDRPKGRIPDGPVDKAFLESLSLPTAATGYHRSQVDALLAAHVAGEDLVPGTSFEVVRNGYDMQAVDAIIDRIGSPEDIDALEADVNPAESGVADDATEPRLEKMIDVEEHAETAEIRAGETLWVEPQRATRGDLPSV